MKNREDRWRRAQQYEKTWWDVRKYGINFDFYRNYAATLRDFLNGHMHVQDTTVILEIGSGAGGIVTFLTESSRRYAIDPLEDFYSQVDEFIRQRDASVRYRQARGENIPFETAEIDLVIMDNVLDHCENPEKVLQEACRVVQQNGLIYCKQNTYHMWGRMVRRVMELFVIDPGHPHTFSKRQLGTLIARNGLHIVRMERDGYFTTWKKELALKDMKNIVKAATFVTRDKVTYLLAKT